MKRALALLEKNQAPTDSRATAQEQTNILSNQGSYPKPRRAPSAQRASGPSAFDANDQNNPLSSTGTHLNKDLSGNLSSRKSTAVSSTNRVTQGAKSKYKVGHARQSTDLLAQEEKFNIIETSLQKHKKKPPHHLKPLNQKAVDKL